jgi:hypothetical protein
MIKFYFKVYYPPGLFSPGECQYYRIGPTNDRINST